MGETKLEKAKKFLIHFLKEGSRASCEIREAARAQDISIGTLGKAKQELELKHFKVGYTIFWEPTTGIFKKKKDEKKAQELYSFFMGFSKTLEENPNNDI